MNGIDVERLRAELLNLVRIRSFYGREADIASYLVDRLSRIADRVELMPVPESGGNVIARFGADRGDNDRLLFLSHMDTVELKGEWKRNPWGDVEDDKVFGLGVWDSKSSVASMIEVANGVSKFRDSLKREIAFAFVSDEEGFSRGTYQLVKEGKLKGVRFAVVGEPTSLRIMKGAYGRFVFDIEVRGRTGIGTESGGINAVVEASKIVLHSAELQKAHEKRGSIAPLSIKSPELVMDYPEICVIRMDHHYPPGEVPEIVRKRFVSFVSSAPVKAEVRIKLMKRPTPFMEPFSIEESNPFFQALKLASSDVLSEDLKIGINESVSAANYLYQFGKIPSVVLGPDGGNRHSSDEYVIFSSVEKLTRIFLKFLERTSVSL